MGTSEEHEKLAAAFMPWVRGDFPEAKNIGDVVIALGLQQEALASQDTEVDGLSPVPGFSTVTVSNGQESSRYWVRAVDPADSEVMNDDSVVGGPDLVQRLQAVLGRIMQHRHENMGDIE